MIRARPRHPRSIDTFLAVNTLIPYTQLKTDLLSGLAGTILSAKKQKAFPRACGLDRSE
jgi:hypothetical protein